MKKFVVAGLLLLAGCFGLASAQQNTKPASAKSEAPSPQHVEFFETKVRPILAEHCFKCHGPEKHKGDLRLDSREAMLKGNESGGVIVPGQPEKSRLVEAVRHEGDIKMPPAPGDKLPAEAIENLVAWIKLGAPWPKSASVANEALSERSSKKHWAFTPVRTPAMPAVRQQERVQTPVDAFVLVELEKRGLTLAQPADRRTLIRRVTFDLTGLPPTAEEIEAFEADLAPDAFGKVVDRLLTSPHYGERWARYWLDVARYADTKGYVFTEERRFAYAYTYRDYVIKAFNDDLPYDRFVMEQLAADRLFAEAKADGKEPDVKSLAAMGFLTLGRRFLNNQQDIIDDRIDVTARGLLGLTVGCARCHDHKFDPIPTKDYYSLYGVFNSSQEPKELPLIGAVEQSKEYAVFEAELKVREKAVAEYQETNKAELAANNRKFRDELKALQKKVDGWKASSPGAPARAMVLEDLAKPREPHVFVRGNPGNAGPKVPRQFLAVLSSEKRLPFRQGSGRLELAQAIASRDNPLTARVLVNRVWLHLFGRGLVTTPSDFGLRSDPPSHPELLDFLAARFMEQGWSIKKLHKLILLSSAYQQSSTAEPDAVTSDPENRLLSHMSRRRLDFEAMRDSLLFVAGRLDQKMGGPPVEMFDDAGKSNRRAIYGFIDRQNLPGLLRNFDFANPDSSSPQRIQTTVPQQGLFLLNSPFAIEQARNVAVRAEELAGEGRGAKIVSIYRLILGRSPTEVEIALGEHFLDVGGTPANANGLTVWQRYAQVLLAANELMFVD
jgi:mono/diheme cytochrome c family protein